MIKYSDWIVINAITYKIQAIDNIDQMRMIVMEDLIHLIDFDASAFYIKSIHDAERMSRPVGINCSLDDMKDINEKARELDYAEGLVVTGKSSVFRESDIIEDEIRIKTQYYKEIYGVRGWHYSLHLNICYDEQLLGVMVFFRKKGKEDFSVDDIFKIDMIKDHLALRLHREYERMKSKKLTVEEAIKEYGLSHKEGEVLKRLLHDTTPEEIAEELGISVSTLRKHCNHIFRKANVSQRIQLFEFIEV